VPKNALDALWYTRCEAPTVLGIAAHLGVTRSPTWCRGFRFS
jgi:hypothetical protein